MASASRPAPPLEEAPRPAADFDVVVVGSGVGGLCAAAKLAHGGRRVLVIEREAQVGGRASTVEVDGFRLPTGGIALELGGPMEQVVRTVGGRYDVRPPSPAVVVRAGGRSINTTTRTLRLLVDGLALPVAKRLTARWRRPADPDAAPTLEDVVNRVTRNATVHGLARNLAAGVFGLNSDEVSGHAVVTYLTQKGAFRRYGFCPRGTIGVLEELADAVRRNGGEVWTSAEVKRIHTSDGRATGVTASRAGVEEDITCEAIVSNAGPAATVALIGAEALPASYVADIGARDLPTPMIVVDVASRGPLVDEAGIVFFADTTRLSALGHYTSTCPEVAPPGWRLYVAYAVPVPALGPFDEESEVAHTLAELRDECSGFDQARVLRTRVLSGDWPAQRAVAGREAPMETPLANVFNVGDGVRQYGDGGMQACAVTGRIVADRLLAAGVRTPA
jgi:phytoene dehydrogenase-like protein